MIFFLHAGRLKRFSSYMMVDKNDYLPAIADDVLAIGHIPSVETISLGLAVMAIKTYTKHWLKLIFSLFGCWYNIYGSKCESCSFYEDT